METELWTYRGDLDEITNLEGFEVAALDGDIGKIDDATYDVGSSYIVVDTGPWIFGKKVLIPAATVVRVDLDSRKVFLMLTKDQIKDSPELSDVMTDARSRPGRLVLRKAVTRRRAMPNQAWSDKRERQYEHIKDGLKEQGRSNDVAEEIAARTVNKERARHGEAKEASRTSTDDISSGRRGGLRSHSGPRAARGSSSTRRPSGRTSEGRSKMTKAQLKRAVDR